MLSKQQSVCDFGIDYSKHYSHSWVACCRLRLSIFAGLDRKELLLNFKQMPPVRRPRSRNHAQRNTNHSIYIESPRRTEAPHKCAVSNYISDSRHPEVISCYSTDAHPLHDNTAYASTLTTSRKTYAEATMNVGAPAGVEPSSRLFALNSGSSPPSSTLQKHTLRKTQQPKVRRPPCIRRKSADTATRPSSKKPELLPPPSLPLPIPRVNNIPPTPEPSHTSTNSGRAPQIKVLPPTLETRPLQQLLSKVSQIRILSQSPTSALPTAGLQYSLNKSSVESEPTKPCHKTDKAASHSVSRPYQYRREVLFECSPHNLCGTFKGPPAQPFTRPYNRSDYRPKLKKHASFIDLRDCWRCPEAELTAQGLRNWTRGHPIKKARRKAPPKTPTPAQQVLPSQPVDETRPLLVPSSPQPGTQQDSLDPTLPPVESDFSGTESQPKRGSISVKHAFECIFFPFIAIYTFLSTAITNYTHNLDVHSGQLGSHSTETARWLKRMNEEDDELMDRYSQLAYGSFSSLSRSPPVFRSRLGSRASRRSRGSIPREELRDEVRGMFGAVPWGIGIGEEYDPC